MHIKQYIAFQHTIGDFDIFLNGYLKMLSKVQIISKSEITAALKNNIVQILKTESCKQNDLMICNIGNAQDSSSQVTYCMNMVNTLMGTSWKVKPLEKVLENAQPGQRIVFLEDAFCSGKQILSVFETYMGIPEKDRQTQESHVSILSELLQEKLQQCKIYFSFICYEKTNVDFFYQRLKEIGLNDVKIVDGQTFPTGYFKQSWSDEEQHEKQILQEYLQQVGRKLIEYKATDSEGKRKENWSEQRMNNSVLGYNDAQQLIAFSWNTPTYTITPLWMRVDAPNFKWVPLFPRIDK